MQPAPLPSISLLESRSTYSLTGFTAQLVVKTPQVARLLCAAGTYEAQMSKAEADLVMTTESAEYDIDGSPAELLSAFSLPAES